MAYKEIAPFIIIESHQEAPEFQASAISSFSYSINSWAPIPALTADLSKLIRKKAIYDSLTKSPGYVPIRQITGDPSISQYSPDCITSSLVKLPYLCFRDTAEGLVVCLNVPPLAIEIRSKKPSKRGFQYQRIYL